MTRDEAYSLVTTWTENKNLIKHMQSCEQAMLALARKLEITNPKSEMWGIAGLIHDADYEKYPDKHPQVLLDELQKRKEPQELIDAIKAHAYGFNGMDVEPKTQMEWALYTCDELTGFIVAVTLVRPDKQIKNVTVENILKKWNEKSFAKGVNRSQIELCDEKLGIKLPDFIQIVLSSMKEIAGQLGL